MSVYTSLFIGETLDTIKMDGYKGLYFSITAHIDMRDGGDRLRLALTNLRQKTHNTCVHGFFEPEVQDVSQKDGEGISLKSLDANKVLAILKKHGVAEYRRNKMAIAMVESAIENGFVEVVVYTH